MGRCVRDARLETRNARLKLRPRHEPYWRGIDGGMHLGYRKGKLKTSWLARFRLESGAYKKTVLGLADDVQDADGLAIFSYSQAQEKARRWFSDLVRLDAGEETHPGRYLIRHVMDDYLAWFKVHRRGVDQVTYLINAHIKPGVGHMDTARLTAPKLRTFQEKLASTPARLRTKKQKDQKYRSDPMTPDEIRRRKVTANKIMSVLRAALNRAYQEGKIASDDAWHRVKPFREVDAAKVRYLTEAECAELVKACDKGFRPLVQAAILTGCRYGEITNLKAGDFNPDSGTLHISTSKSGKPRHVVLTDEGKAFFEA
ncbi:MAG: tyrosine-type recombinase/integrase, partial [Rhodospirillales bacterium]|nr:tyrosine-type recombinase/integrase [Rhodospirillales bacterium]